VWDASLSCLCRRLSGSALLTLVLLFPAIAHADVAVSGVPDLDGDGRGDYVVGAIVVGREAHVFSGATGQRIHVLNEGYPLYGAFGSSVAGVADLNGDGLGDVAVGDFVWGPPPNRPDYWTYAMGRVYVYDGATGERLHILGSPNAHGGGDFGDALSGIPDVNGDGLGDILVGASGECSGGLPEEAGKAYLFDGRTGEVLQTFLSPNPEYYGHFGQSVSGIPDVNGDGRGDVIVGANAEGKDGGPPSAGRAYVFDGKSGQLLHVLVSPSTGERGYFGESVSGVPDLNGDGAGDVIVGAYFENPGSAPRHTGRAYVFNGATGALLHTLASPNEREGSLFGNSVSGIRDLNGDGRGDVVVAAALEKQPSGRENFGRVYVFDGATGNLIQSLFPPSAEEEQFGYSVSTIRDADGDGRDEIMVVSYADSKHDSSIYHVLHVEPDTIRTLIESFYHLILDRKPEDGAVESWESGYFDYAVAMGVDVRFVPREMGRLFFLSDEYTTRTRTDAEFVSDCYWAFLDRDPRQAELDQWLGTGDGTTAQSAESGDRHVLARSSLRPSQSPVSWNRAEVMTIFAESEEFAARIVKMYPNNPGDPSRNFVTAMYVGLLDRLADKEGLEYAASLFDAAKGVGQPPSAVESSEGKDVGQSPPAVESSEGKGVGQPPSAVEFPRDNPGGGAVVALTDGATKIRSSIEACRTQAKQTAREILASDEFQNLIDSAIPNPHSAIVARLYRAFLGRFPADHERAYWTGELDAGRTTTDAMIDQFAAAPEFTARLNQHFGG